MRAPSTEIHGRVRCEATDEDDSLSRSMMIECEEHPLKCIWIKHVASEIVLHPLHPYIGAPLHLRRAQLHLKFYLRDVAD